MTYIQKEILLPTLCISLLFLTSQLLCSEILSTEDHKACSLVFLPSQLMSTRFFQQMIPVEYQIVEGIQKRFFCSFYGSIFEQLYPFYPSANPASVSLVPLLWSSTSFRSLFHNFSISRHHPSREVMDVLLDSDYTILFLLFSKNQIKQPLTALT